MENIPQPPQPDENETDSQESDFEVEGVEIIRPTSAEDISELLARAGDDVIISFAIDEDNPRKTIITIEEKD